MADDGLTNQDEIEKLLAGVGGKSDSDAPNQSAQTPPQGGTGVDQSEIDALLSQAAGPKAGTPGPSAAAKNPAPKSKGETLGQQDIDALLKQTGPSPGPVAGASAPANPNVEAGSAAPKKNSEQMAQEDVEYLLSQAQDALDSIESEDLGEVPPGVAEFQLERFAGAAASSEVATLDLLRDVDLDLKIELGRTHMYLEDVLKLKKGSVVPLDKLAGDPVDIFVNGRLVARGEVLVLNDNFCVRVTELVAGSDVA